MNSSQPLRSATRPVRPEVAAVLRSLTPGQRIRVTQTVRVGRDQWTTTVEGAFRDCDFLATGLATDRVPEDDIVAVLLRFTKDNGELSSVTIDERSAIEVIGS